MAAKSRAGTSETGRIETFSDGVFAITLTLLVLDLRTPASGSYGRELLHEWPTYVAYLGAFVSIAAIWISHHNLFVRIDRADSPIVMLNLLLLLGSSLVPWPTALLAASIRNGYYTDEVSAIAVYLVVSVIVVAGWLLLALRLAAMPHLLVAQADARWIRRFARKTVMAGVFAAAAGAVGLAVPVVALVLFLAVPLAWLLLALRSEGADPSVDSD